MAKERFSGIPGGLVWPTALALVLTAAMMFLLSALTVADEPEEGRPLPDSPPLMQVAASSAPGYCPSLGGSTQYERITGVNLTSQAGGTMRLVVQVYIANPKGCKAGKPCPSYDPSPEFVNVWIDWNGDKTWDASEQVMNQAGTGYLNINYRGTMTFIQQLTPPAIITTPTWLRANLGWDGSGIESNSTPCRSSWSWGNVLDQMIHVGAPVIERITVVPTNPETTRNVDLWAAITPTDGYEVVRVAFSGDLPPGEATQFLGGNNYVYTYTPDAGTHGRKRVRATLTYRHTPTGSTGQTSRDHEFKLFFIKEGDDDGDGMPNWFEYWKADGAVSELSDAIVEYDSTLGANTYGYYDSSIDKIRLGGAAGKTHYPAGLNVNGIEFGGAKGIDTAAEVVIHEKQHKIHRDNWRAGGAWAGQADSDRGNPTNDYNDLLPDSYETGTVGTVITDTDTFNLEALKSAEYKYYGDDEYNAMRVARSRTGVANKDWANPGKQSTPAFDTLAVDAPQRQVTGGRAGPATPYRVATVAIPGLASLTGSYTDQGVDTNGDSRYESLRLSAGVQVTTTAQYNVVAWLRDGSGSQIAWAKNQGSLSPGSRTVNLDFDGETIYKHGAAGPYTVSRVELRIGDEETLIDSADNVRTTTAYSLSSFARPAVGFTGSYSTSAIDTDGDSLYNTLRITVGLDVAATGTYTLAGWLRDVSGSSIASARTSASLSTGAQQVNLDFDGRLVRQSRKDGPYRLGSLKVEDASGSQVNFATQPYTTTAYTFGQFEWEGATLKANSYSDTGVDLDGDGTYDYLRVSLSITATQASTYTLAADLVDSANRLITSTQETNLRLTSGSNTTQLEFPGQAIYTNGVNGPYTVTRLLLLDASGIVADQQTAAHATAPYTYTAFGKPLVALTGSYQDYGQDTDGDGKYDRLVLVIGVSPSVTGTVVASGRLVDSGGQEIQWASSYASLGAGTGLTITLPFTGTVINASGRNGPYTLRNLYVYSTGDPEQGASVAQAHTTAAYSFWDFQASVRVNLPMIFLEHRDNW